MKLYVLRRYIDRERLLWSCADGFVIRAEGSKAARRLASEESGDEGKGVWLDLKLSSCDELIDDGLQEVILSDFCEA